MATLLKEESTITAKGQTTVPKAVRQALGVDYGGRIAFVVDDRRRVHVERAEPETSEDPVVDQFLVFLAQDMANNAGHSISEFPEALLARAAALTEGVAVDLDDAIEGEVAI